MSSVLVSRMSVPDPKGTEFLFDPNQIQSSRLQLSSIEFYPTSSKLRIAKPMRIRPRFSSIPTASGAITRAAYARAVGAGLDVEPLLKACGLTVRQVEDSNFRIAVKNQIRVLNLVAEALSDEFLGVHLAESVDLRALGLFYYVLASSTTLGDALQRASRYSAINNEGIQITFRENPKQISIIFRYFGVPRLNDRHQIEFFVVTLLRA